MCGQYTARPKLYIVVWASPSHPSQGITSGIPEDCWTRVGPGLLQDRCCTHVPRSMLSDLALMDSYPTEHQFLRFTACMLDSNPEGGLCGPCGLLVESSVMMKGSVNG